MGEDAKAVPMTDEELYLGASEARDITVSSGLVFRIRSITNVEYQEAEGTIPEFVTAEDGSKLTDAEKKKLKKREADARERAFYERFVEGLVDRVTGKVTKIPYDKLLVNDGIDIGEALMARGGLDTMKAAQIRRALPES